MCFINEFMSICKIIGFTKQIYENKSLSPNHVFTFKIPRFTTFIFLLIILYFLLKLMIFQTKLGPYGPQPGAGPNPDWVPTRDDLRNFSVFPECF